MRNLHAHRDALALFGFDFLAQDLVEKSRYVGSRRAASARTASKRSATKPRRRRCKCSSTRPCTTALIARLPRSRRSPRATAPRAQGSAPTWAQSLPRRATARRHAQDRVRARAARGSGVRLLLPLENFPSYRYSVIRLARRVGQRRPDVIRLEIRKIAQDFSVRDTLSAVLSVLRCGARIEEVAG